MMLHVDKRRKIVQVLSLTYKIRQKVQNIQNNLRDREIYKMTYIIYKIQIERERKRKIERDREIDGNKNIKEKERRRKFEKECPKQSYLK